MLCRQKYKPGFTHTLSVTEPNIWMSYLGHQPNVPSRHQVAFAGFTVTTAQDGTQGGPGLGAGSNNYAVIINADNAQE